jgi:hypothetical protein
LNIYGCDFSGAKDPTQKIYVAKGELNNNRLFIMDVVNCEERLDLFYLIETTKSPWGLDFPFSIPEPYITEYFGGSWDLFISDASISSRIHFSSIFGNVHSNSNNTGIFRNTDLQVGGKSPISSTPIGMLNMLYGGRKLLNYLRNRASVYPFDPYDSQVSRLYEVYPKHAWNTMKLTNSSNQFNRIPEAFQRNVDPNFNIRFSDNLNVQSLTPDAMDSIMACIILGYCVYFYSIEDNWNEQPSFSSRTEWNLRKNEGLILRIK